MADYQQIIEEIRFALQSENCELTDELRAAAQDYALACRETNQRLRKIESYLNGGLRSEAIQLAAGPPDLDELISVLNFSGQEEWTEVVAIYDLPRYEPLLMRVVDQLNDAKLVELPLQSLMARHRLLALHRAPLKLRLGVLRELMAADPETSAWEDDARTFEKARFEQFAQEIQLAQRNGDLRALKQLHDEIAAGDWLETPPSGLKKAIKTTAGELARRSAQRQLEDLAGELEAAFHELDFDRAKGLAGRWHEVAQQTGPGYQSPILDQVSPILDWVQAEETREAHEQRAKQLIAQLEMELGQSASIEELDQIVHEIHRLDRELPEVLGIRYQNRREALQIGQERTHRLQLGSVAAAVVVVVVGVGVLVRQQVKATEVERVAKQVEGLLDQNQLSEAQAILENRGDISQWDRLVELQTRLSTEIKQETDRKSRFQAALATAQGAESFREAIQAIGQAGELAVAPDEQLAVSELRKACEKAHNEEMAAREKVWGDAIQNARQLLIQTDHSIQNGEGSPEDGERLVQAAALIGDLQRQAPEMRPEFSSQIRLLEAKRKELDDQRTQRLLYHRRLLELTGHSRIGLESLSAEDAVANYRSALLALADAIPEPETAERYRNRATEDPFWRAALLWSKQTNQWPQPWPRELDELISRAKACRQFLADHPGAPDAATAKRYADQLESMIAITGHLDGSDSGLQTRLLRAFSSALVEKSWQLTFKDGRVFYVPEVVTISPIKLDSFQYLVGYGETDVQTQRDVRSNDLVSLDAVPSPSQRLANFVKERLKSLSPDGWNDFSLELAARILNDEHLNDFLKLDLLKRSLELAGGGDVFLKDRLQGHVKMLQDAPINPLARWMNPNDLDGKRATNEAREVLMHFRRMKSLDDVWADARRDRDQFANQLKQAKGIIGWLQAGPKWIGHVNRTRAVPDGDLFVAYVPDQLTASEWRAIGQIQGGEMKFKNGAEDFLAPGRPVFAAPKPLSNSQSAR